jgi:putative flippase GtrA
VQLVLFGVAGAIAFATEVGVFALVYWTVALVALANALAIVIGSAVSYTLQARVVFRTTAPIRRSALRYAIALCAVYAVSTPLISFLVHHDVRAPIAKVLVSAGLAPFAYLTSRHWVYRS